MAIEFRGPTEAFAAVAWVVCTADKHGSVEERDFLYGQVQNLDIKNYNRVEFQCPVCGKRFYRKKFSTRLNSHKDRYGNRCYGRTGSLV